MTCVMKASLLFSSLIHSPFPCISRIYLFLLPTALKLSSAMLVTRSTGSSTIEVAAVVLAAPLPAVASITSIALSAWIKKATFNLSWRRFKKCGGTVVGQRMPVWSVWLIHYCEKIDIVSNINTHIGRGGRESDRVLTRACWIYSYSVRLYLECLNDDWCSMIYRQAVCPQLAAVLPTNNAFLLPGYAYTEHTHHVSPCSAITTIFSFALPPM